MIQFNQVSKQFKKVELFTNINLFLPKASYTFIGGSEDQGKTTLLQMIMAYEKPSSGTLTVDDMDISTLPKARIPFLRRQIGLVESNPLMLENRTVAENIAVPMQIAGFDSTALKERVTMSINLSKLESLSDLPVGQLNHDQRRLVAMARATVHRPQILLVDTPEAELNESTELTQKAILQSAINDETTVVVTGKLSALPEVIDNLPKGSKALVIHNGTINPYENIAHPTRD